MEGKEITITLVTELPDEYRVPEDPIVVPTSFSRKDLSKMINDMLSLPEGKKFDFLIENNYLRSPIQEYLEQYTISTESTLSIEYILQMQKPSNETITSHQDWISHIQCLNNHIYSSSYDGKLQISTSQGPLSSITPQPGASIQHFALHPSGLLICGMNNGYVHIYTNVPSSCQWQSSFNVSLATPEKASSIETVAVSPRADLFAVGRHDGRVFLFNTPTPSSTPSPVPGEKRERQDAQEEEKEEAIRPRLILEEIHDSITSLYFVDAFHLLVGSLDQTVRIYDVLSGSCVATYHVTSSVLSADVFGRGAGVLKSPLCVATTHEDGRLRVWTMAVEEEDYRLKKSFFAHRRAVMSVAIHPDNECWMATTGHDGVVRVFDVRSEKLPIQVINMRGEDELWRGKALAWLDKSTLVSGGSDGKLRVHVFANL